jgi:isopentenyl-diphosphate delta-isomerase
LTETNLRKEDHLRICLDENVQARTIETGFQDIHLIHRALPEIAIDDVNLSTALFDHTLSAPIIIETSTRL